MVTKLAKAKATVDKLRADRRKLEAELLSVSQKYEEKDKGLGAAIGDGGDVSELTAELAGYEQQIMGLFQHNDIGQLFLRSLAQAIAI